jgi:Fe-S cluster assembly protein SufD
MQHAADAKEHYLAGHREFLAGLEGGQPSWLGDLRREALDRFAEAGFPHKRMEDWRYTSVDPLIRIPFRAAPANGGPVPGGDADEPFVYPGEEAGRLVFIDGRYAPHLSSLEALPGEVWVNGLAATLAEQPELLEEHLSGSDPFTDNAFTALNTAFLADGGMVVLPPDTVLERPVHLLYLTTASPEPTRSHPRTLVVAGDGSRVAVIVSYAGAVGSTYFTNAVCGIVAGRNATVDHLKIQRESEEAFHLAALEVRQAEGSTVRSVNLSFGACLARNDIIFSLEAEDARCTLDGLYLVDGERHVDNQTTVDHRVPRCHSQERYKGILAGRARGVFNGRVIVRPDAQQTDARQSNRNLLLSDDVEIHAKPQLEIHADDVACAHGATVGRLDEDALFYLRSRGLGAGEARLVLTRAFAGEILESVRSVPVRRRLEEVLNARLAAALPQEGMP